MTRLAWFKDRKAGWAIEVLLMVTVFAGSYSVGYRYLDGSNAKSFAEWELMPAVMMSCGHGFTEPGGRQPVVTDFLVRNSPAVTCQEFAWGGAPRPAIHIARAHLYSIAGAAMALRLGGQSWQTLDAYISALFALSMVMTYGLFRQGTGRWLAVIGVIALVCSNHLFGLLTLRDFVKLPCFVVLWLVLAWMIRRGLLGERSVLFPASVAGAMVGLGLGFRVDVLVFIPVFVLVLLFALPGFTRDALKRKALAVASFIVAFGISGAPILSAMSGGSNSAHVTLLGMMRQYDRVLGVDSAPYDVGNTYSDGFAYTVIAAYGSVTDPAAPPVNLGDASYDRTGGRLISTIARQFPADAVTRALGATAQIFRYPFDWRIRDESQQMTPLTSTPVLRVIGEWRSWLLGFFEGREPWALAFVLVLASRGHWKVGLLAALLTIYFCGYSMLQFSRRHTFHLDIIPLFMAILAVQFGASLVIGLVRPPMARPRFTNEFRKASGSVLRGAAAIAALAALIGATVYATRAWQQRSVEGLLTRTLETAWAPLTTVPEPLAATIVRDGAPIPTWSEFYQTNPARWSAATLLRIPELSVGRDASAAPGVHSEYLRVDLVDRCSAREVQIGLKYTANEQTYHQEFTRIFTVPMNASGNSVLLVPVYFITGPTLSRFDGFAVPAEHLGCIETVRRATAQSQLGLPVMAAVLPPGWQNRPLYQRVQGKPDVTLTGTPVSAQPEKVYTHRSGWRTGWGLGLDRDVPALIKWDVSEGVSVTEVDDGHRVVGNAQASGYQLMSPRIDVTPNHVVAVQIAGAVDRGVMCFGVLDGAQQRWLLAPDVGKTGFLADTKDNTQVILVFANCGEQTGEFTVRDMTYTLLPPQP